MNMPRLPALTVQLFILSLAVAPQGLLHANAQLPDGAAAVLKLANKTQPLPSVR